MEKEDTRPRPALELTAKTGGRSNLTDRVKRVTYLKTLKERGVLHLGRRGRARFVRGWHSLGGKVEGPDGRGKKGVGLIPGENALN